MDPVGGLWGNKGGRERGRRSREVSFWGAGKKGRRAGEVGIRMELADWATDGDGHGVGQVQIRGGVRAESSRRTRGVGCGNANADSLLHGGGAEEPPGGGRRGASGHRRCYWRTHQRRWRDSLGKGGERRAGMG